MPTYEYTCERGHRFDVRHKIDGSDAPTTCPEPGNELTHTDPPTRKPCGAPIVKLLSAPASTFPGASRW